MSTTKRSKTTKKKEPARAKAPAQTTRSSAKSSSKAAKSARARVSDDVPKRKKPKPAPAKPTVKAKVKAKPAKRAPARDIETKTEIDTEIESEIEIDTEVEVDRVDEPIGRPDRQDTDGDVANELQSANADEQERAAVADDVVTESAPERGIEPAPGPTKKPRASRSKKAAPAQIEQPLEPPKPVYTLEWPVPAEGAELAPKVGALLGIGQQALGIKSFRPGQAEAFEHLLNNEDLLAVMPTGSGKSLLYQLTSLVVPGVTVVVSPLIAL
ncbi:MAG TPA: DEAD/DEAH box helicase, partial [Kofleriaceae bacterium]|nr:DEAD/DEAH box helicase [Kofleriaceae bacterium]